MTTPLARIEKFETLEKMQHFLRGGIMTSLPSSPRNGAVGRGKGGGIVGLVGTTLTIATPALSLTFVAATLGAGEVRDPNLLLIKDIKAQIEAAQPLLHVVTIDGFMGIIETTPSAGITMAAATETGRQLLGFAANAYQTHIYGPPGGTPPTFEWAYNVNVSGMHVVFVWE